MTVEGPEFEQQHKGYAGQEFALIRIARCYEKIKSPTNKKFRRSRPEAYLLILESTREQKNEYRRLGLLTLDSRDDYSSLNEMNEAKWKWKKVRLV